MKPITMRTLKIAGLIVPAFLVCFAQVELDKHREIRFVDNRPVFLPRGKILTALTMGHRGLVSDWLWINTVLYYGRRVVDEDNRYYQYAVEKGRIQKELAPAAHPDSLSNNPLLKLQGKLGHVLYRFKSRGLVNYIYPMLDAITTLDPHFIFPYVFGGVYVLMDTGEIDAAVALLEKGYAANPDSWELPFYLGWVYWMYKSDLQRTYQYLLEAMGKQGCRDYVGNLLRGVSQNLNRTEMTRMYLQSLLQSTDSPEVKKRIEAVLNELSKHERNQSFK
jgi:tetratricopeptide (TPR) repeat protein